MSHCWAFDCRYGLLPGVHYVTVPTAADVPAMVKSLRANDSYARAVAQAGRCPAQASHRRHTPPRPRPTSP